LISSKRSSENCEAEKCYAISLLHPGRYFKISNAKKVQKFDFINLKSEKQICKFIDISIHISYFTQASAGTITIIFRNKFKKNYVSGK